MRQVFKDYFSSLFTFMSPYTEEVLECVSVMVSSNKFEALDRPFVIEEIKEVLCTLTKALGLDGFLTLFYQHY